ncbi:MAG: prepilin-type N-terminal cleavage/methylation domain-containing protein [Gallionella sp.]
MKRDQSGFTLIEMAIVLVIITLLLGGVLKGQELINSAKVKNLATDFTNIPIYIYGYQSAFKATPGDDAAATIHLTAASGVVIRNGDGNGIINGNWNDTITQNSESFNFWQQLRLAGYYPGTTDTSDPQYIPTNAVGGKIGVTNALTNAPITGLAGTYVVCSDNIPGKFAKQLDIMLDDGNTAIGLMMVTGGTNPPPPAPVPTANIVDNQPYLVCMGS